MNISPLINRGISAVKLQALPKKLTEIVPDTKVFKNMTHLEKNCIGTYIKSIPYRMGITPEEVAQLSKFDGEEFVVNSFELLTKKLGLSEEICPALYFGKIAGDGAAYYSPACNVIMADLEKFSSFSFDKGDLFKAMRHELQHFLQYSSILRHEKFGEKAILANADSAMDAAKKVMKNNLDTYSIEQLEQMGMPQDQLLAHKVFKDCLDRNDVEGINSLFGQAKQMHIDMWTQYRQNLINKMGLIKENSSLTPKIKVYHDEFNNIGYYRQDNTLDLNKYFSSKIEAEAILTQLPAELEYRQIPCGVKFSREAAVDTFNDPKLKKYTEEMAKNSDKLF